MSSILDALKKLELEREKKNGQAPAPNYSSGTSRDLLSGPDRRGPRTITLTPAKLAIGAVTIGVCMVVLSVAVSLMVARGGKPGAAQASAPTQTHVASALPAHPGGTVRGTTPAAPGKTIQAGSPTTPSRQNGALHTQDTSLGATVSTPSPRQPANPPVAAETSAPAPAVAAPTAPPQPPRASAAEPKELVVTEQAVAAPEPPAESTPRPVQKPETPLKAAQVPTPAQKEPPKKAPAAPTPEEPARVEVARATPKSPAPDPPLPASKNSEKPKPALETDAGDAPKPASTEKGEVKERPLDGEEAKSLSEEINLSALPTLSESERLRLDLPKLKINIVGLPTKRQPHPSALINLNKVYVGENIPNTDARLIAVELRGVGIEVNGRKYFLPK